jgi:hypothetical protein
MTSYQATPEQWAQVQKCADVVGSSDCSAILELRTRVEALEANAKPTPILAIAAELEGADA